MRDPRNIITQTAFTVSPDLINYPLASRHLRLLAILLDLFIIGLLAVFGQMLFAVAAGILVMIILKPRSERTLAVKIAGWTGTILVSTLVIIITVSILYDDASLDNALNLDVNTAGNKKIITGTGTFKLAALTAAISSTDDPQKAKVALKKVTAFFEQNSEKMDLSFTEYLDGLAESHSNPEIKKILLDERQKIVSQPEKVEQDALSASEVVSLYAKQYLLSPDKADIKPVLEQLEEIYTSPLNEKISDLNDNIVTLTNEAKELNNASPLTLLKNFISRDLGIATGWSLIYFTMLPAWWPGYTTGKWICRIKIVRLDGHAITLWNAFERFGGYAAGFATSLLGFIQIYWDANRQCIHDKIANTTVIPTRSYE